MQKKWGSMERQLLERMIGAIVLLVALVLIVPAILDGGGEADVEQPVSDAGQRAAVDDAPSRRIEIRLDEPADTPPLPQPSPQTSPQPSAQPSQKAAVAKDKAPDQAASAPVVDDPPKPVQKPPAKSPASVKPSKPAPVAPKPTVAPKTKKVVAFKTGWIVQLGSFSNQSNAQGLADRAKKKGFDSYLTPLKRSGKTLYRVRVGPPQDSRDKAAKLADDLRRAGFTGQVAEQVAGR